ncbi:hypothetical protein CWE06_11890 [Aliidiomarina haloalkalitolerans]|uniref:Uncharacterized protein n=1 Tax=Aliidiomarina haloalkalitolerans TaxID=859059 RepID=A0A432VPT2_9GAMM|nr:hypothetical protein CWE06_11890 [Aliidiomarina haloalkalitolerans]
MQVPTQIAWLDILLKNVLLRSLPKQGSEFYATGILSQGRFDLFLISLKLSDVLDLLLPSSP